MMRNVIRGTEDRQSAVTEELVHVPTGIDDRGHHDLKQRIEAGNGVLRAVGLGERCEIADVDEHHRHLPTLTDEHVITLLK